jgi:hypothetical protein
MKRQREKCENKKHAAAFEISGCHNFLPGYAMPQPTVLPCGRRPTPCDKRT